MFSVDGRETTVRGVYPQGLQPTYRVTFRDGRWTECSGDHLWRVSKSSKYWKGTRRLCWQTITTEDILADGVHKRAEGNRVGYKWRVPVTAPVEHPEADLPLPPYTLGALIGDGTLAVRHGSVVLSICDTDQEILDHVRADGTNVFSTRQKQGCTSSVISNVKSRLQELGLRVKSPERFIPAAYKTASVAQRRALLAGLMDTDGTAWKGRTSFSTLSPQLAEDVAELVRSLGGVAIVRPPARRDGEVSVNVRMRECPFRLRRKAARWKPVEPTLQIQSIARVEDKESVCIAVDNPSRLYITRGYTVTHNTSMTLSAFVDLQDAGEASKMLVIAPLKVCQLVWRQEGAKWSHTSHLSVELLHGKDKDKALKRDADIYLINYEGLPWLSGQIKGNVLPFDVVVADELTRLKNAQSKRFKAIKRFIPNMRRRWGLTGTPAPNGYLDLFGQFLFIDQGRALGQYFTHYRSQYFDPGFDGFSWTPRQGAREAIEAAMAHLVCRITYDDLPELIDDPRIIEPGAAARKAYTDLKKAAVLEHDGEHISAANAAALVSKLRQMANGAVYVTEEIDPFNPRPVEPQLRWVPVHDDKLDALKDLLEELQGKPCLVAYSFRHDLERIKGYLEPIHGEIPVLGAGVKEKDAVEIQRAWNAGELPILLCHPASVGHGLNLQEGGAAHLCWFSADYNLELYEQFCRRVWRKGSSAPHVFNHKLIMKGTIDEDVFAALDEKDVTQSRILDGLARLVHNKSQGASPRPEPNQGDHMPVRPMPAKGGGPAGWGGAPAADNAEQDDSRADVEAEAPRRPGFSQGLQRRAAGFQHDDDEPIKDQRVPDGPKPLKAPEELPPESRASEKVPDLHHLQQKYEQRAAAPLPGGPPHGPEPTVTITLSGTFDEIREAARRLTLI